MMPDSSIQRLQRHNREAIALLHLGVGIDLGFESDPVESLRDLNDRLSRVSGDDVESILQDDALPRAYRSVARMLLAAEDPTPIFQSIAKREEQRSLSATPVNQAISEPLVIFFFSYLGMMLICLFVLPHIEKQFENQWQEPGRFSSLLLAVRAWLPVWAIVTPIAMLITLVMTLRNSAAVGQWLPGSRKRNRWLSSLGQVRRLHAMAESDVDAETALELARHDGEVISPFTQTMMREVDRKTRQSALRRLTLFYRFLVQEPATSGDRGAAPMVGILIGGLITLGFALVLFLPWIEVLHSTVIPGGRP